MVRGLRKEKKLTAEKLADKIDVDRTYISKIERKNYLPSTEVYESIQKILGFNEDLNEYYLANKFPNIKLETATGNSFVFASKNKTLQPIEYCIMLLKDFIKDGDEGESKSLAKRLLNTINPSVTPKEENIKKLVILLKKFKKSSNYIFEELKKYAPQTK